eukprot:scaffold15834_cov96-Isochrysis_galbana.AAC.2
MLSLTAHHDPRARAVARGKPLMPRLAPLAPTADRPLSAHQSRGGGGWTASGEHVHAMRICKNRLCVPITACPPVCLCVRERPRARSCRLCHHATTTPPTTKYQAAPLPALVGCGRQSRRPTHAQQAREPGTRGQGGALALASLRIEVRSAAERRGEGLYIDYILRAMGRGGSRQWAGGRAGAKRRARRMWTRSTG